MHARRGIGLDIVNHLRCPKKRGKNKMATDCAAKWISSVAYDRTKFANAFAEAFGSSPQYNAGSLPGTFTLLGMIEKDRQITDLRWAAYMLATILWETTMFCPCRSSGTGLNRRNLRFCARLRPVIFRHPGNVS